MSNKEHTKSIILVLLILMSIVLTYMVWNFSPDLSNIDNTGSSRSNKPKPLARPMTAEMEGTITPFQTVHSRDDKSQGTMTSGAVLDKMIQLLEDQEVKSVSRLKKEHNFVIPELNNDFIVLNFAYDLPLSTYLSQILDIDAKVPNNFNFDRLLIDQDHSNHIVLYVISKDCHEVIKPKTAMKENNADKAFKNIEPDMQPYTEIIMSKDTIDKTTHVSAPSKPKNSKIYCMVFSTISIERMNLILFDDSTIVRSSQSDTTTYNNNAGVANYNDKDEMYHYKNLSGDAKSSSNMQETIPGTYEFINSRGGFLNEDYRLFETDNRMGRLTYQRFLNDHLTLSKQSFNKIQVTWGDKGAYDYQRSLFKTDVTLNSRESRSVPTAESIRSTLASHPNIDFEKITSIAIGYDMDDKANNEDIEIQRNCELMLRWFVEHDDNWYTYKDGRLK